MQKHLTQFFYVRWRGVPLPGKIQRESIESEGRMHKNMSVTRKHPGKRTRPNNTPGSVSSIRAVQVSPQWIISWVEKSTSTSVRITSYLENNSVIQKKFHEKKTKLVKKRSTNYPSIGWSSSLSIAQKSTGKVKKTVETHVHSGKMEHNSVKKFKAHMFYNSSKNPTDIDALLAKNIKVAHNILVLKSCDQIKGRTFVNSTLVKNKQSERALVFLMRV